MLKILVWVGWAALLGAGGLVTLFMSAFGDEPRTKRAVQRALTPVIVWFAAVVYLGVWLINRGQWWSILLAVLLTLSPPVVLLALIGLSMRWDSRGSKDRNVIHE